MPKKTLDTITDQEADRLISLARLQRNRLIIMLMLDAGLRVGEVVQLRRADLWYNQQPRNILYIRPVIAKRNSPRSIPLSARLQSAIRTYACLEIWKPDEPNDPYVFKGRYPNTHLRIRSVQTMIDIVSYSNIGRRIHPHQLRHTFATKLMQNTNIRVVQELLGHKHLTSTQVYTHPNHQDLTKAINSLTG